MQEVEKILFQIEDFPLDLSGNELEEELNQRSRLLGKKQSGFSVNSEEYKEYGKQRELVDLALKRLRDMAKENSALVPSKAEVKPKDEMASMVEEWENSYIQALKNRDIATMQRIYRQVSKYAETGNGQATNMLAIFSFYEKNNKNKPIRLFQESVEQGFLTGKRNLAYLTAKGYLRKKDLYSARALIEEAANEKHSTSMYQLALELLHITNFYEYEYTDRKKAYSLLKEYIQKEAPLDMENEIHRRVLYLCYKTGYELKLDMCKESVAAQLQLLIKYPGKYTTEAKGLEGAKSENAGDYDEAIQTYLEHQTVDGIKAIETIFFKADFAQNRDRQRQLDKVLENLRDQESTDKNIRIELYNWYGWRYENGKAKLAEKDMAFWCYYKKSVLLGKRTDKYQEMLDEAKRKKDIGLFEDVIAKGAYDICFDAGFLYRKRRIYDKALANYRMAYEYGEEAEVRELAKTNFEILKKKVDRQRRDGEECEPVYRKFMAAGLSNKLELFKKMQSMIYRGKNNEDCNTYACLKVAEIVENDTYIQDCLKGVDEYSERRILWLYQQTEHGDFEEGISKLYEIYTKGLYGEKIDKKKADYYKILLE